MRFEDYTKDQQKAIISKGTNIIVSAGAGSGKTQVLTERVLHFIKNEGYNISQFLILTFTNLAAQEMKNRIRKALVDEGLDKDNNVDTAYISTFDSYALSIVKKYHFLLNVSKDVSIVDSNIIEVRKRTIIVDIFEELYQKKDPLFLKLIEDFCFKDDIEIRNLVLEIYNQASLEIDSKSYLDNFIDKYYNDELILLMKNEIIEMLNGKRIELNKLYNNLPDVYLTKTSKQTYKEAVSEVLNVFLNATTYDEYLTIPKSFGFNSPRNLTESDKENIKSFKSFYEKIYKFISKLPNSDLEFKKQFKDNVNYVEKILDIIKELDRRINDYKKEHQVFEFNDIAKMALNVVKNNLDVLTEIKQNLKMIMVDEYQDTSIIQETFINCIATDNLYMVGDVKQSIYRFRNARCDIFIDKYNAYKKNNGGITIDLNKNFRSRKEVLDDINFMFKSIMTLDTGGASYIDDHIIEYGNKSFDKGMDINNSYHSDVIKYQKDDMDQAEKEARLIALDIISKINNNYLVFDKNSSTNLRTCKFSDFAILMDRGTSFEIYAKVFNEYQLPLHIENDENIKECDMVLVLTNLLKIMKCIMQNDYISKEFIKSFVSLARSFVFNYSDDEIYDIRTNKKFKYDDNILLIKDILYKNSLSSLYDQFESIVFGLNIYNKCIKYGEVTKNEKYLDTFLEMFKNMSKLDYSLDDFILYLENINNYDLKINLSSTGSNIESIRLMNIHKSKGLEFNIVYFSGLYRKFNQKEYSKTFGMSKKYGIIFPTQDEEKESVVKILNKNNEIKEDLSERIRLFYVALTRTKEKMIFVYCEDEKKSDDLKVESSQITNNKHINSVRKYLNNEISKEELIKYFSILNIPFTDDLLKQIENGKELNIESINEEEFLTKIKQLNQGEFMINHFLYFNYYPNQLTINKAINNLGKTYNDFSIFEKVVNDLGYHLTKKGMKNFTDLASCINELYEIDILSQDFNQYFKPNEYIYNLQTEFNLITNYYHLYILNSITKEEFIKLINVFNFDLDIDFINNDEYCSDINRVICKQKLNLSIKDAVSFSDFVSPFISHYLFEKRIIDINSSINTLDKQNKELTFENLDILDLVINYKVLEHFRPSKNLQLTSNNKSIELGTKLHHYLEYIDFYNPNYDLIENEYYQEIIKQFLNSELMKNRFNAKIFKEYEFIDEENHLGIIDLMLVYDNYIDIIDYKTKNVNDNDYLKQLTYYQKYISSQFNKPVNVYLYSLLTQTIKKCN